MTADFVGAKKHIRDMLDAKMPLLPYHNMAHVHDVVNAALLIGASEQLPEEEIRLLHLAALLHDAGFIGSATNHEETGVEMARGILPAFGYNSHQTETICKMILATKMPQSPDTLLERILCDADLDYLGRNDFYEIAGKLFMEMKDAGIIQTEREWNLIQQTFLKSHRFHTAFALTTREPAKQLRLREIMLKVNSK